MTPLIKMETEVEIKATAEQFYQVFRTKSHHLPNICTEIDSAEILDGEWDAHGSTRSWDYKFEGKSEKFKEKVEFDDEKMRVTHVGLDGDLFKHYKTYKAIWEAVPKPGGEGAIAKVSIVYEKVSMDAPSPEYLLNFMVATTAGIDAYISGPGNF